MTAKPVNRVFKRSYPVVGWMILSLREIDLLTLEELLESEDTPESPPSLSGTNSFCQFGGSRALSAARLSYQIGIAIDD